MDHDESVRAETAAQDVFVFEVDTQLRQHLLNFGIRQFKSDDYWE